MKGSSIRLVILSLACLSNTGQAQQFTDVQRNEVVAYWNSPGRYQRELPPSATQTGPYQVRLTVAGSTWLWNYNKARGIGKVPPGQNTPPQTDQQAIWEKWIEAKINYDWQIAGQQAAQFNTALSNTVTRPTDILSVFPGSAPQELIKLAGNPPVFAEICVPNLHLIRFEDGLSLSYSDNVPMRNRYAYYRFEQGVMSAGKKVKDLPKEELTQLFQSAGLTESERKVMSSVSLLEGGFESVNTYDTGFVSIGFIQFACLKDGSGSLGRLLKFQKQSYPEEFASDFRKYGIDADEKGSLVVVDPSTGAELKGSDAALKIIDDKRLIAVFQRAGMKSNAFKICQILSAKNEYLPSSDVLTLNLQGKSVKLQVGELIKSEAGMATLMDRKVNTGSLEPLAAMVTLIANENGIQTAGEIRKFERDIIVAMRYRKDYLTDTSLTQPPAAKNPGRDYKSILSRAGTRGGRGG